VLARKICRKCDAGPQMRNYFPFLGYLTTIGSARRNRYP
jgi:hypothetical protein